MLDEYLDASLFLAERVGFPSGMRGGESSDVAAVRCTEQRRMTGTMRDKARTTDDSNNDGCKQGRRTTAKTTDDSNGVHYFLFDVFMIDEMVLSDCGLNLTVIREILRFLDISEC